MEQYPLLIEIILGGIAGVIAEKLMNFNTGLILSIVLGIVGAVVGNYLLINLLHLPIGGGIIGTIIIAVVGACVIIWLYRLIASRR